MNFSRIGVLSTHLLTLLVLTILLCVGTPPRTAQAYPLNPWPGITSRHALALTPFVYVSPGATINPILYASYGVSDRIDVFVGASGLLGPGGGGPGTMEFFPRFFLTPGVALVAHVYYTPASANDGIHPVLAPAPELHINKSWGDLLTITSNIGYRPVFTLGGDGGLAHSVTGLVAFEHPFSKQVSVFLEVDPSYLFGSGATLTLVPGIGFALEAAQTNSFAVGVQVTPLLSGQSVRGTQMLSAGMWYSRTFGG